MIRTAFVLVLALGALLSLGLFWVVRGTEPDVTQITATTGAQTQPTPPVTPQVDQLHYLRDVDFDQGDITVMFHRAGPARGDLIVRDQEALRTSAQDVYINTNATTGQTAGSVFLTLMGAPPSETVIEVYRRDSLIAAVRCTNTACGSFANNIDVHNAGLLELAVPHTRVDDSFDDYETYLETILAISEDPNFMMLDRRPTSDFPAERIRPFVTLGLPTVVVPDGTAFDRAAHEDRIRTALAPVLDPQIEVRSIRVEPLPPAVIADKDNNQPVTAGGVPIQFPHAQFYDVRVGLSGTHSFAPTLMDHLKDATLLDFDVDSLFAEFVTARLQTTCVDCYFLKIDGPFRRSVTELSSRRERYYLSYYDLREAP